MLWLSSPTAITFWCATASPRTISACSWFVSWYSSTMM